MIINESMLHFVDPSQALSPAYFNKLVTIDSCKSYISHEHTMNIILMVVLGVVAVYLTYSNIKNNKFKKEKEIAKKIFGGKEDGRVQEERHGSEKGREDNNT